MNSKSVQKIRDSVWSVLLENTVTCLPVDVATICRRRGYKVWSFTQARPLLALLNFSQPLHTIDGLAVKVGGCSIILYNENRPLGRIRTTIAHELGHIELGHLKKAAGYSIAYSGPNLAANALEAGTELEANDYALRLLAPTFALVGVGATSAEQIATVCNIDYQSALVRALRLSDILIHTGGGAVPFGVSMQPKEQAVYNNFAAYIRSYRRQYHSSPSSSREIISMAACN